VPIDVPEPAPTATFADPCLRRVLAIWAIGQLEDELANARDALKAIAAIPPPESELVAAALQALPEDEQDARMELFAIAFAAGHRELVVDRDAGERRGMEVHPSSRTRTGCEVTIVRDVDAIEAHTPCLHSRQPCIYSTSD
jgi:hypothetical protein